jgi:hypothetical protein
LFKDFYFSYKACDKWSTPESLDTSEETVEHTTSEDIIAALPEYTEDNDTQSFIQVSIFRHLHDMWPKRVHFTELTDIASSIKGEALDDIEVLSLADLLQTLYLKEIIHIHLYSPSIANDIPTHPHLNSVARYQATYQEVISTQLHDMVVVRDEWVRSMVTLMDGTRTVDDIAEDLYAKMIQGDLPPLECKSDNGEDIVGKDDVVDVLRTRMLEILASFLENGALV